MALPPMYQTVETVVLHLQRQRTYRSFPSTATPPTPPTGILKEKTAVFREEIDGTDYEVGF